MTEPESPPSPPPSSDAWPRAFTRVVIVALILGAGLYVFQSLRDIPGDAVDKGRELIGDVKSVAAAFRRGTIETSFVSYATRVSGTNRLQFATLDQMEVWTRSDEQLVLWDTLALPDVVVSATAPVEYTYYLDLEDPWSFTVEGDTLFVEAPPIHYNQPAIDASQIHYEVRESSFLRDEDEALLELKAGLSKASRERAAEHIPLIRELGRAKTRDFVRTWLVTAFGDGTDYRVEVTFADEDPPVRFRLDEE